MLRTGSSILLGCFILAAHGAMVTPAVACSAALPDADRLPLLPQDGQTDVPINAALITRREYSPVRMVLKQAGSGGDAGAATEIPLDIACSTEHGFCVATPQEHLRPNTTYVWSAAFADEDPPPAEDVSRPLTFTTGARQEKSAFDISALTIQPTDYHDADPNFDAGSGSCEFQSKSGGTLTGKSGDLQRPAILVVLGGFSAYGGPPLVFSSNETFDFSQYDIQDCVAPAVIDFTGKRHALAQVCVDPKDRGSDTPDADSPDADATSADDSGSAPEGNASDDAGARAPAAPPRLRGVNDDQGCEIKAGVNGSSGGAWALSLVVFGVVAAWRRRRLVR